MANQTLKCLIAITNAPLRYNWVLCHDLVYCLCLDSDLTTNRVCSDMITYRSKCAVSLFFTKNAVIN